MRDSQQRASAVTSPLAAGSSTTRGGAEGDVIAGATTFAAEASVSLLELEWRYEVLERAGGFDASASFIPQLRCAPPLPHRSHSAAAFFIVSQVCGSCQRKCVPQAVNAAAIVVTNASVVIRSLVWFLITSAGVGALITGCLTCVVPRASIVPLSTSVSVEGGARLRARRVGQKCF